VIYAVTKLNFVDVFVMFLYIMRPYVIVVGCVPVCRELVSW
jgi:hypothetical protein